MSEQPLTAAVFQEFQRKLDRQFDAIAQRFDAQDRRFDALEKRMDTRFDEVAGQIDAVLHRVLSLQDEFTAITEGLARVEREMVGLGARAEQIEAAVLRLDGRLSRVEKRLDDLVAAEPRYALRTDVQDLKGRMDALHQRVDALEKRIGRK